MADILRDFLDGLKTMYGEKLRSVVLYGSKANGEDAGDRSDYNLMLILDEVKFEDLLVDGVMRKWIKQGNPPPLLFSKEMFARSTDVFPIEFLDMQDNRIVLYGENPFTGLKIDDRFLRHQCEYELKGKLLKLRQGYMASRGKPRIVRELLVDSLSSVLVVFSHVLRLCGEVPPVKKQDALLRLSTITGIDPRVFVTVRHIKRGDRQAKKSDPNVLMREYLRQIEQVVEYIDRFEGRE